MNTETLNQCVVEINRVMEAMKRARPLFVDRCDAVIAAEDGAAKLAALNKLAEMDHADPWYGSVLICITEISSHLRTVRA